MQSSIIYAKSNILIQENESVFSDSITLPKGTCLGAYVLPVSNKKPNQLIEIGVQNSQGSDIISSTDFRDYTHKGGGYFQGVKQLNFPTENNRFLVNVNASENITEPFIAQMVFIIEIEK